MRLSGHEIDRIFTYVVDGYQLEIAGGRIHAPLGASRPINVRSDDEDHSAPVEGLGDTPVAHHRGLL